MSNLEQAAWDALALCERIIEGKRIWSLSDMREVSAPLRAALEQAEPVAVPPKSFRVGYMTGYADGQRELRKKQQAEPVTEPAALTHDEVQRLAAQAGLPLAWISETGVIQWSQLERLIALVQPKQAEPVAEPVRQAVALKWLPAPRKTEWGSGMVSADVEIDRDHTLTLYCEEDQTAKVDAMFRRVFCKEEQPEPVQAEPEAVQAAVLESLKAIVEFADAPVEAKRPDVFFLRINNARAAIARAEQAEPVAVQAEPVVEPTEGNPSW